MPLITLVGVQSNSGGGGGPNSLLWTGTGSDGLLWDGTGDHLVWA